jgi:uncharacterized protein (DUF433 family)
LQRLVTRRPRLYTEMLGAGAVIHGERARLLAFSGGGYGLEATQVFMSGLGWNEPPLSGIMLNMTFTRITIDPAICTGKPCIRGLRFPVARLLGLLAAGETREQILQAYPYLEAGDIDEALRYAAFLAEDETIELAPTD